MTPTPATFPKSHFVFVEKVGPFQETARQAWQELHASPKPGDVTGAMALYDVNKQIYRAGWIVKSKPTESKLRYEEFAGGKFTKFTYKGPYEKLPQVSGEVWAHAPKLAMRDGFAIESYLNDPATTAPNELVTEIYLPTH